MTGYPKKVMTEIRAALWECPVDENGQLNFDKFLAMDRHIREAFKLMIEWEKAYDRP